MTLGTKTNQRAVPSNQIKPNQTKPHDNLGDLKINPSTAIKLEEGKLDGNEEDFTPNQNKRRTLITYILLALLSFVVAICSNGRPTAHFDYTLQIANALLHGHVGIMQKPMSWLTEFVPVENGEYYSVFPLGSVLTMLPFQLICLLGIKKMTVTYLAIGIIAATTTLAAYGLANRQGEPTRILFALLPMFGTWMWPNIAFGGSWQLALGFAVAATLGSLYFTTQKVKPLLAGSLFAIAFGNRTEILLLAPILAFLLYKKSPSLKAVAEFLVTPAILLLLTSLYNFGRFHSPFDFGYSHIPHILEEECYRGGIFSLNAIQENINAMIYMPWKQTKTFALPVPKGFGGSIFISCPLLLLAFLPPFDFKKTWPYWTAIPLVAAVLLSHGNPGGWQVSYRYALDLLPWFYMILLNKNFSPKIIRPLIILCIFINLYSTWIFCFTKYMKG